MGFSFRHKRITELSLLQKGLDDLWSAGLLGLDPNKNIYTLPKINPGRISPTGAFFSSVIAVVRWLQLIALTNVSSHYAYDTSKSHF